jgi:hypothetical protein
MALGSTQPATEMSTRNIPGGKGRPALKADLIAMCVSRLSRKCGASTAFYRDSFTLPKSKATPVTGLEAHRVVRRRGSHIF